jgi:integrase
VKPDYAETFGLYSQSGSRKYLNRSERRRVVAVMAKLGTDQALFALTLAWTGARLSEVLALTPSSFQIENCIVAFRTLKRRRHIVREVPIPQRLVTAIGRHFKITRRLPGPNSVTHRLWPWSRTTAWRVIKKVMLSAQIVGSHATPRGLRHSFGIGALQAGVPLNLVQRWMGHARISTTAIYAAACGPEEIAFAKRFWRAA